MIREIPFMSLGQRFSRSRHRKKTPGSATNWFLHWREFAVNSDLLFILLFKDPKFFFDPIVLDPDFISISSMCLVGLNFIWLNLKSRLVFELHAKSLFSW